MQADGQQILAEEEENTKMREELSALKAQLEGNSSTDVLSASAKNNFIKERVDFIDPFYYRSVHRYLLRFCCVCRPKRSAAGR